MDKKCDIIMITMFVIILIAFGLYKYINSTNYKYNELDCQTNEILNKKIIQSNIIKQNLPNVLTVEDYRIPELTIREKNISAIQEEVKIMK